MPLKTAGEGGSSGQPLAPRSEGFPEEEEEEVGYLSPRRSGRTPRAVDLRGAELHYREGGGAQG